jgi:hypothetical protein
MWISRFWNQDRGICASACWYLFACNLVTIKEERDMLKSKFRIIRVLLAYLSPILKKYLLTINANAQEKLN